MAREGSEADFQRSLTELVERVALLQKFGIAFANNLAPPVFYDSGKRHSGFRYASPDERHFCLLKFARMVSALGAMTLLARGGFTQEIAVLIRTIAECDSQIQFVLLERASATEERPAKKFVEEFFNDFARNEIGDYKKSKVRQGFIHDKIGSEIDRAVAATPNAGRFAGVVSERLHSQIYLAYSGYVHCKYPETIDLFGGSLTSPDLHLGGMRGTPKDFENIGVIDTFTDSTELSARHMILAFKLFDLVKHDAELVPWYQRISAPN